MHISISILVHTEKKLLNFLPLYSVNISTSVNESYHWCVFEEERTRLHTSNAVKATYVMVNLELQ